MAPGTSALEFASKACMPALSLGESLRWLLGPFLRLAGPLVEGKSAWERVTIPVPAKAFGPGSDRSFTEYFKGETLVRVASIDDIVAWLQTCEYVDDLELFHKRDYWQHPSLFEQRRRGDCEDFALWAWRKLAEVGIEAEFYVGRVICEDRPELDRQHAWVVFHRDGTAFVFEPTARIASRVIRPLEDAMAEYVPHFAVNHRFETCAFEGCASDPQRRVDPAV